MDPKQEIDIIMEREGCEFAEFLKKYVSISVIIWYLIYLSLQHICAFSTPFLDIA